MSEFVAKFIKDQEAAVQIARDVSNVPSDYNIRVDALNAALAMCGHAGDPWSTSKLIDVANDVEKYLKGVNK